MELNKIIKLISFALFALLAATCTVSAFANIADISEEKLLPKIEEWQNGELKITKLDAVSGYKGIWLEREYKNSGGRVFLVTRMDGDGVKGWKLNQEITDETNDGPIGSGATYRIVKIYAKKHNSYSDFSSQNKSTVYTGALSIHPLTGVSIVTSLNKKTTITIETRNATESECIKALTTIIESIN